MSNLQDKINQIKQQNEQLTNDAIDDIDKQTYEIINSHDRLTIDRVPRESRRQAALKILEKVKSGEIDKVDEDDIYETHHDDEQTDHSKDAIQTNVTDETDYGEIDFNHLDAISRLQVISELIGKGDEQSSSNDKLQSNDNDNDKLQSNDNDKLQSEVNNTIETSAENNVSQSTNDDDEVQPDNDNVSQSNEHNSTEQSNTDDVVETLTEQKATQKQGFFARFFNKLFGGN